MASFTLTELASKLNSAKKAEKISSLEFDRPWLNKKENETDKEHKARGEAYEKYFDDDVKATGQQDWLNGAYDKKVYKKYLKDPNKYSTKSAASIIDTLKSVWPYALGAGAVGGAATGYMANQSQGDPNETPEQRRKRVLGSAVMGAGLSGGAALAAPVGYNLLKQPIPSDPGASSLTDKLLHPFTAFADFAGNQARPVAGDLAGVGIPAMMMRRGNRDATLAARGKLNELVQRLTSGNPAGSGSIADATKNLSSMGRPGAAPTRVPDFGEATNNILSRLGLAGKAVTPTQFNSALTRAGESNPGSWINVAREAGMIRGEGLMGLGRPLEALRSTKANPFRLGEESRLPGIAQLGILLAGLGAGNQAQKAISPLLGK